MRDLVANNQAVKHKCAQLGITPLVLEEDATIIQTAQQTKNSPTLLLLADNTKRELIQANIDGVINLETSNKKDFLHHRRSNLEQVSTQLLKEKNAALILTMQAIREATNPAQVLGRMQQNARIAQKKGLATIFVSAATQPEELPSTHDQEAFWRAHGFSEQQIAANQQTINDWLAQAKHRASEEYVAEGITKNPKK